MGGGGGYVTYSAHFSRLFSLLRRQRTHCNNTPAGNSTSVAVSLRTSCAGESASGSSKIPGCTCSKRHAIRRALTITRLVCNMIGICMRYPHISTLPFTPKPNYLKCLQGVSNLYIFGFSWRDLYIGLLPPFDLTFRFPVQGTIHHKFRANTAEVTLVVERRTVTPGSNLGNYSTLRRYLFPMPRHYNHG